MWYIYAMKILSISAAPGWFAQYKEDDGTITEYPLACWGLVQDAIEKGESDIVGFMYDREVNLVERVGNENNFAGYRHESVKTPQEIIAQARRSK